MTSLDELYSIRLHMAGHPDHELVVGEDDEWRCLTCEAEGEADEDP